MELKGGRAMSVHCGHLPVCYTNRYKPTGMQIIVLGSKLQMEKMGLQSSFKLWKAHPRPISFGSKLQPHCYQG